MKRNIYQKLLMSFAIVAFFGTMVSAQPVNPTSVSTQHSEVEKQKVSKKKVNSFYTKRVINSTTEQRRATNSEETQKKNSFQVVSDVDKTSEEYRRKYRQDVTNKMNAADNEEDRKKYKAILESLK